MSATAIARVLAALAVAALVATAVLLVRYESARDAWRVHGAAIGTDAYDAGASDAAYRDVEDALTWLERAARVAAGLVVVAGVALGRARPRTERHAGSRGRALAARALDVGTLALAVGLSRFTAWSPGVTACVAWLGPALVASAALGALANGASLGARASALTRRA